MNGCPGWTNFATGAPASKRTASLSNSEVGAPRCLTVGDARSVLPMQLDGGDLHLIAEGGQAFCRVARLSKSLFSSLEAWLNPAESLRQCGLGKGRAESARQGRIVSPFLGRPAPKTVREHSGSREATQESPQD